MTQTLNQCLQEHSPFALAFSGGVDSAYLLYAAMQNHCDVTAYFIKTPFQPEFELLDAKKLAGQLNAPLKIIELPVLADKTIAKNPVNRCYYCKKALFTALTAQAARDGYSVIFDGTNASDQAGDRPGMQALTELDVRSPLRECGLTKEKIRELSKKAGLFTWEKPSYACLATRIPSGTPITSDLLTKIENAEQKLASYGYRDFRIRVFHGCARLQLLESQFGQAIEQRELLSSLLSPDFGGVLLDLTPRKGDD